MSEEKGQLRSGQQISARLLCVIGTAERSALGLRLWIIAVYEDGILLATRPWRDLLSGFTILEGAPESPASDPAFWDYKRADLWDRCSRREELLAKHRRNRFIPALEIAEATLRTTLRESGRSKQRLQLRLTNGATIKMKWKNRSWAVEENPPAHEVRGSLQELLGVRLVIERLWSVHR